MKRYFGCKNRGLFFNSNRLHNFFLNLVLYLTKYLFKSENRKRNYHLRHRQTVGVSPATVSRALNDSPSISIDTRKKINALAEKLGLRHNTFASSLRLQKTHTIGVILHELNSYFITSVLAGIEKVVTEAKYNLIIVHSAENAKLEVANARNLFHKRVDGVIASLSFDTEDLHHFKQFQNKNIPVVFFDRVFENSDDTKVIINNFQAGYDATTHLIRARMQAHRTYNFQPKKKCICRRNARL